MLIGTDGVYSYTFEHEKKPDCPVCGGELLELSISSKFTVEQFIEMLTERQNMYVSFPSYGTRQLLVLLTTLTLDLFRQPNQEAFAIYANEADLLAGTTTA